MLHPKNNRIDYGEQLIPPQGYSIDYAVGTTYSLDLESLMILPVALFYSQNLDSSPDEMRYDILDAITKSSEKIRVYYQSGKLKVPRKYHNLMAYWEQGIYGVTMPHYAASFHPKVWIIRYTSPTEVPCYRILVTSRNLTNSRDWDVAFSSEGYKVDHIVDKSLPLVHFLKYLEATGGDPLPERFLADLKRIEFELPDQFRLLNFYPIGIPNPDQGEPYEHPLLRKTWDELLVISPFVQDQTIRRFFESTSKPIKVLSRKLDLDGLTEDTLKTLKPDNCYQFSELISEAENREELSEDKSFEPLPQNLHAKIFVARKGDYPHWFLGSANATEPAFGRNIEFLVELKGDSKKLLPSSILTLLTDSTDKLVLFEPYRRTDKGNLAALKKKENELRKVIYDLTTKLTITGSAKPVAGGVAYDLVISIDATRIHMPKEYIVRVKPLPEEHRKSVQIKPGILNTVDYFTGYTEAQLSPFVIFEVSDDEGLQKEFLLPMKIALPETRLGQIFKSIIDSQEKFIKYLFFVLTGTDAEVINKTDAKGSKHGGGTSNSWFEGSPVFEKLMLAASRYPQRMQSADQLMRRLKNESGDEIIPDDFQKLWAVFMKYVERSQ